MEVPKILDVFVCGPQLYADNLAYLRLHGGMVIWEPFENETSPAPELLHEVYQIPAYGALTLFVTDEGLYLTTEALEQGTLPANLKAVQL